jgi:hypothetical protein
LPSILRWSLATIAVLALPVILFISWETLVEQVPNEIEFAAPKSRASQPVNEDEQRRNPVEQDLIGESRRIAPESDLDAAVSKVEIWTLEVHAEEATGAALAVDEGSVTFKLAERGGFEHRVPGRVEAGRWSAELPCEGAEVVSVELWAARVGGRRFVEAAVRGGFEPRFDGTDVLVLRPAPETLVRVIDPRTGELASAAELLISTPMAAGGFYRISLGFQMTGEPVRIDELGVRELDESRHALVHAVIDGVGEVEELVELGSGRVYELRPERSGSVRVLWHRPADFWPRDAVLVVRPTKLASAPEAGSDGGTRRIKLGARYSTSGSSRQRVAPPDGPWREDVGFLADGEYLAEIVATPIDSTGLVTLGSKRFVVAGTDALEVVIETAPRESDPWRLLRIELELPAGVEARELAAGLRPVDGGGQAYFTFMPVVADRMRFATALVLRGRHEFALSQPLPFASTIDVTRCPEHVERVALSTLLEYRVRFRHAASGRDIELHGGNVAWRMRGSTLFDSSEWPAVEDPQLAGASTRILAPGAIELRLHPSGAWVLAEGEWAPLTGGGDQLVSVRLKPSIVVRVSTRDDLHNLSALVQPWVRRLEQGTWMELPGLWSSWDTDPLQEFEGWLPFEGEFVLDLRCDEDVLPLQQRRGALHVDQRATFDFELVRAR